MARICPKCKTRIPTKPGCHRLAKVMREALANTPTGVERVLEEYPAEPTKEMLIAARDWSYQKYGKPIGNDAAIGCYKAMRNALRGGCIGVE